jgi:hypothetical protein
MGTTDHLFWTPKTKSVSPSIWGSASHHQSPSMCDFGRYVTRD